MLSASDLRADSLDAATPLVVQVMTHISLCGGREFLAILTSEPVVFESLRLVMATVG